MTKYNLFGKYYNGDAFGELSLDIVDLALLIIELVATAPRRDLHNYEKVKIESLEIEVQEE